MQLNLDPPRIADRLNEVARADQQNRPPRGW
jgi:hypothetical protein